MICVNSRSDYLKAGLDVVIVLCRRHPSNVIPVSSMLVVCTRLQLCQTLNYGTVLIYKVKLRSEIPYKKFRSEIQRKASIRLLR